VTHATHAIPPSVETTATVATKLSKRFAISADDMRERPFERWDGLDHR
jgi:hypothetical protein